MRPLALLASVVLWSAGCAAHRLVLDPPAMDPAQRSASPLQVIASVDKADDPLPLKGEGLVFEGVADSLGKVIADATTPWVQHHRAQRPGGWEMKVELQESRASSDGSNRRVELAALVTLTATRGQIYLAQTHGYCRETQPLERPAPEAVYACMENMARDVAGWLEGIQP